jgi:hypothetical protein
MRLQRCTTPSEEAARGAWRPRQHDRRLRACGGQGKQWEATVTVGHSSSWREGEPAIAVARRGSVLSAILAVSL